MMVGIRYRRQRSKSMSQVKSCSRTVVPFSHGALGMMAEDTAFEFGLDESVHFSSFIFTLKK